MASAEEFLTRSRKQSALDFLTAPKKESALDFLTTPQTAQPEPVYPFTQPEIPQATPTTGSIAGQVPPPRLAGPIMEQSTGITREPVQIAPAGTALTPVPNPTFLEEIGGGVSRTLQAAGQSIATDVPVALDEVARGTGQFLDMFSNKLFKTIGRGEPYSEKQLKEWEKPSTWVTPALQAKGEHLNELIAQGRWDEVWGESVMSTATSLTTKLALIKGVTGFAFPGSAAREGWKGLTKYALKRGGLGVIITPGNWKDRLTGGAILTGYMMTPVVSRLLPNDVFAVGADIIQNLEIDVATGKLNAAIEKGWKEADDAKRPQEWWKYTVKNLIPTVTSSIAMSLMTRSAQSGNDPSKMVSPELKGIQWNSIRDAMLKQDAPVPKETMPSAPQTRTDLLSLIEKGQQMSQPRAGVGRLDVAPSGTGEAFIDSVKVAMQDSINKGERVTVITERGKEHQVDSLLGDSFIDSKGNTLSLGKIVTGDYQVRLGTGYKVPDVSGLKVEQEAPVYKPPVDLFDDPKVAERAIKEFQAKIDRGETLTPGEQSYLKEIAPEIEVPQTLERTMKEGKAPEPSEVAQQEVVTGEGFIKREPQVKGRRLPAIDADLSKVEQATVKARNITDRIADQFTRFRGLESPTRQSFINLQESDIGLREAASQAGADLVKGIDPEVLRPLQLHIEQPDKYPQPEGTDKLKADVKELSDWSFFEVNRIGLNKKDTAALHNHVYEGKKLPSNIKLQMARWPTDRIGLFEKDIAANEIKIKQSKSGKVKATLRAENKAMQDAIDMMEGVEYLHRVTTAKTVKARAGVSKIKTISKKARGMLGRKFPTIESAEEAGFEVKGLPEAMADSIYITNKTIQMNEFIDAINKNPEFSAPKRKAPTGWVEMKDQFKFPAFQGMRYHPSIANALNEVTYVSNKHDITRVLDKINTTGKIIGFYNPAFMTRYNITQGVRGVGLKWFKNLPEAHRIWSEKGETYDYLRKNGLFNKAFDLKQPVADMTTELLKTVDKSKAPPDFKKAAKKYLNPVNLWKYLNQGTWKMDEGQRIATWLGMKDNPRLKKYYSDFEIIELANDFHANYGKMPAQSREILNRMIFTPTYKISMARIVGRMHTEPKALWPSLLRHWGLKTLFSVGIPTAANEFLKRKKINKRVRPEGYRMVVSEPRGKEETVYSMSGPMLEGKKILNRPWNRTIEYNMASLPSAILTTLRGPLFKKSDETWEDTVSSFFKTGAPVLKELMVWRETDKNSYQKFMQIFGLAFIYKRNKKEFTPEEEKTIMRRVGEAVDLWGDWKTFFDLEKEKKKSTKRKSTMKRLERK